MSEGRIILNANLGKTNVVDFETFAQVTLETLDEIIKTILPLCGEDAMHDLVIYKNLASQYMSNVFSNDGIHILKNIEHMSPIQTYITNYIRYIAERVEKAAGDGTSTAIIISCSLISAILHDLIDMRKYTHVDSKEVFVTPKSSKTMNLSQWLRNRRDRSTIVRDNQLVMAKSRKITEDIHWFLSWMLQSVKGLKIDLQTLDLQTRKALIYRLAMTTSKGNQKLTEYAVQLFLELPEILYEYTNYTRSPVETDEDLKIDIPEHDVCITVMESNNTQYNSKLNTELLYDHCDLLVIPRLYGSNPFVLKYLEIRSYDSEARPLIIVLSGADDHEKTTLERSIDKTKVTLCTITNYHQSFTNNPLELKVFLLMAGIDPIESITAVDDVQHNLITDVKCRIYDHRLYVYRLFPENKTSNLHPYYISGEHDGYNKMRLELEAQIDRLKTAHNVKVIQKELDEFIRIYRMMICSRLPTLIVGGSTIDHLANINVVNDVLGVVSVAMKHGVIFDLIPKLVILIQWFIDTHQDVPNCIKTFCQCVVDFGVLTYKQTDVFDTFNEDLPILSNRDLSNVMFSRDRHWEFFIEATQNDLVVVQSYKAIAETIVRLIETVPRLTQVDKIIVPDSVMEPTKGES